MSVASAIRILVERGFTMEQALLAAEIFEAEAINPDTARTVGAKRQARYRERKASQSVTQRNESDASSVTERNESVTDVTSPRAPIRERVHDAKKVEDKISSLRSDIPAKQKTASRLTPEFRPSQAMRAVGRSAGLSEIAIDLEGEKIRDWSMSAKGGAKLDWEAAWRNWIKNRTPSPPTRAGPNGHKPEHLDPWAKAIHKAARERNGYAEQEFSFEGGLKDVTPDADAGDAVEEHAIRP